MKLQIVKGSTSQIVTVFIQDSSSTTGAGLGSLDQASSIVGGYVRTGSTGVALAVDEDVTAEGTYQAPSAAGKVRIGTPANMRTGTYELHFHNDLFAVGANSVFITLGGASDMADLILEIQLTDVDLNDGVRGGMTALPNAAAEAAGGVYTRGSGAGQINQAANGQVDTNTVAVDGTAQRATDLAEIAQYLIANSAEPITNYVDDDSLLAKMLASDGDISAYNDQTHSLEAIRVRGDQAWLTGAGGSATASYTSTDWTRTEGDNDGGAGSDTTTVNATYFATGETNSNTFLEVDVTFDVTDGEVAESVDVWGFYNGGGSHYIRVQAENDTDSLYEDIGIIGVTSGVQRFSFSLTPDHTDRTNDEVKIKFLHGGSASGIAAHVLNIDKAQVNTLIPVENLTAAEVVDEWETQSQADPTGFHINVKELDGSSIQQAGGVVESDMVKIHGTALTETATQLAGRFVDFFDQASATFSVATALSSFKATGFATSTVCTEGRLAELDAANLPADIDQIKSDLPSKPTKGVGISGFQFFMVLTSDHVTGGTGLTVTPQRSIDGAAFAGASNAVSEIGNGVYKIDLSASDMNGDAVCLKFTAATADARIVTILTQPT